MRDTYRFYFQAAFPGHTTELHHVQVPDRPCLVLEETIDADGTVTPGKGVWKPLLVKYFWPEEEPNGGQDLFKVLAEYYQLGATAFKEAKTPEELMTEVADKLGTGTLLSYHKQTGRLVEKWTLGGLWPHTVDFGELCYSSRADVEINVAWRFLSAKYEKATDEKPLAQEEVHEQLPR